ncbi:ABC transporter ATP-binding protein [Pseudooceanicola nanhaiensis]|uniref:ABC transporter ATP-binding protein n=1 Tax=Pseudooceanicola nanhaiensis TaxID=375761 RepID=UPI001CD2E0A1|nr:ABC transporter ATP-binding protein [Pseudooceanicola nanhaiensis]MCA0920770.1 ABC transporter ATP-binding protein [Pseudooceanicola nanhaiensis]
MAVRTNPEAPAMSTDRILLQDLSKVFTRDGRQVQALTGVNAAFQRGEFITLFGPSGCGKTSLLRIIAGLEAQSSGEVSLFGQSPATASQLKNIAWVPQSPALLPWLSLRNNVLLSERLNRRADRRPGSHRQPEDADAVLRDLGLADFAGARPAQLSGGMRQRAAMARAFVQGAELMLMDEPFSALDELTRDAVRMRLLQVWEKHRKTVIFVTHSAAEAVMLSDRVLVMTPRPGRVHREVQIDLPRPRTQEVLESPAFDAKLREVRQVLRSGWEGEE